MRLFPLLLLLLFALPLHAEAVKEIDWAELIPPEEVERLEALADAIDHSGTGPSYTWESAATVPAMDGRRGKLPGYIVPISVSESNEILEFFLVPYFGACIHVPPPPPNQILYVKPDKPLPMVHIWDAFWVQGTIRLREVKNELAHSAYAIDLESVEPYR